VNSTASAATDLDIAKVQLAAAFRAAAMYGFVEGCGSPEVMQVKGFSVPGGCMSGLLVSVRA